MVVKSLLKASLKSKLKKKKGSQKGKTVLKDETQSRSDASDLDCVSSFKTVLPF